jgi:hypothetical protein
MNIIKLRNLEIKQYLSRIKAILHLTFINEDFGIFDGERHVN